MKKNSLIILVSLLVLGNQSLALTFDDIISTKYNEQQVVNMLKKMSKIEKKDFLDKNFDNVIKSGNQIDDLITMLYLMPKDSFNDKTSLSNYVQNAELALIENHKKTFGFLKNRAKNQSFNIYYESLLTAFIYGNNAIGSPQYKNYDLYNNKLCKGDFNFSDENDRKHFLNFITPILDDASSLGFSYDNSDEILTKIMNAYFSRIEFKGYKIKSEYHIYKLGYVILEKYNENSADFILKKLNDKDANLENLCYFLSNINFNTPVSEGLEQDFDSGFYNPQDNPFAEWSKNYKIFSSYVIGNNNPVIEKLNEYKIVTGTNTRFTIVYMNMTLNPNTTRKEFKECLSKDIERIGKQTNLTNMQKEELVKEYAVKRYKQVLPKVLEEQTEQSKRFEERMKDFDKFLKKYPDALRIVK